jgi:hypothetical protein
MKIILIAAIIAGVIISLTSSASAAFCAGPGLVADFNGTPTSGSVPLTVVFVDMSGAPGLSNSWDFENDGIIDVITMNTTHTYSSPGVYTVMHGITGPFSSICNETKTDYILISQRRTRDNASLASPIVTLDEAPYNALVAAFQPAGNSTNVTDTASIVPDVPGVLHLAAGVYQDTWGNIALVIIFAIPFLMAWIMGMNVTLPSVMGIITGGFVLWRLPEQYQLVAIGFIAMSAIAIIYSLLKEPK